VLSSRASELTPLGPSNPVGCRNEPIGEFTLVTVALLGTWSPDFTVNYCILVLKGQT
jgi:hypothetical protein